MHPGRPVKTRYISAKPSVTLFSPRGRRGRPSCRRLALDELEALKLADVMGLDQKSSARRMRVSQQTYSRILARARRSVAAALASGEAISISGGRVAVS